MGLMWFNSEIFIQLLQVLPSQTINTVAKIEIGDDGAVFCLSRGSTLSLDLTIR